jgi:hypothetical protein
MKHNLHGDISKDDLELAQELLEMEAHCEANLDLYGPAMAAKFFTCIAHDFYELGDDDKGSELLERANKVCPGYFDNQIKEHIEQSHEFKILVESLTQKILAIASSLMED